MSDREEWDVAVVVFCRARGVDYRDASSGAEIAVRHALAGGVRPTRPQELMLPQHLQDRGFTDPVLVASVMDMGVAGGNGYTWTRPTSKAYGEAGMYFLPRHP